MLGLQTTHTSTLNSMFARLGTDYEISNQLFFAILEARLLFNIISLFYYVLKCFCFVFVWCPCMAIDVSVQHNGEFLADILYCLLLIHCYYH